MRKCLRKPRGAGHSKLLFYLWEYVTTGGNSFPPSLFASSLRVNSFFEDFSHREKWYLYPRCCAILQGSLRVVLVGGRPVPQLDDAGQWSFRL